MSIKKNLQIRFAVESRTEGHVVEGARRCSWAFEGWHSLDTVFGLVWWQLATKFIGKNVWLKEYQKSINLNATEKSKNSHLIGSQDSERIDDLLGSVCVGVLACHEVEEGVEVNEAGAVGIDNRQNALEV